MFELSKVVNIIVIHTIHGTILLSKTLSGPINKGNIEVDVDSYIWVKVLNYKGDNSWMLSKIIGEADSLLSTINIVNVRTTEGRLHNYLTDGEAFPKEAQPEKYFKVCIEGSSKTIVIPDS